jgi:DNA gyrase inhibitor GyrI
MDEKVLDFVRKANSASITIKHRNNIDVVFMATNGDETHAQDPVNPLIKFSGYWINIASSNPYIIDSDQIYIKTQDIVNWFEVQDPRNA